jgi:hypothetical protein
LLEPSFQQDLNGDGTIGPKTTTIESFGATKLVEAANQFHLWGAANSGPTLKFQGSAVTDGQFGAWKPIGGEKTASGYEVAFRFGNADQYLAWNTDAQGNYTGNATGLVGASDASLQLIETSFQQDLNGDGTIGAPTHVQLLTDYAASSLVPSSSADSGVTAPVVPQADPVLLAKPNA